MPSPGAGAVNNKPATHTQYVNDPSAAARDMRRQYSGRADGSFGAQVTAATDTFLNAIGFKTGFQDTAKVVTGVIHDGTSIANEYIVHIDNGTNPLIATATTQGSVSCMGASELNTYVPGTRVILMVQEREHRAFILGSLPVPAHISGHVFQDYISQASRNRVDDCHKKHLKHDKSGMQDNSNWRPYDATMAGEWGAISATGGRIFLDDFMMQAAVNEFCGVYGFYHDSLLRVAGYNMQVWTAGSERESFMDQAECNDTQGYTPYPWENMGVLQVGQPVIEEYDAGCFHCFKEKPYYSHWENKHEFAQPYHRSQVFFGYLGQGMRQIVHAPPYGKDRWTYKGKPGDAGGTPYDSNIESNRGLKDNCTGGPDKLKDHDEQPVFGLSEENKALDGRIFIASAKGVHISKRILLPFPQRIRRPEDYENGDDAEKKYKAASKFGGGPDHDITGTIKTTDKEYPNLQRAAALLDLHGYLYNYAGLHAFYWHEKDYKTWEQQELPYADVNQKIPQFGDLMSSKMYLKEEEPKQFWIDHRYNKKGQQDYYETESFISLLDDGGVVIGDGYGAEIRMTGGCVFISAPGDVWLKGGRDVQSWAGNDIIERANKTIDISSTEKNVRIKAEKNILVLAGNDESSGVGGILLESRGKRTNYDFEKCGDDVSFGGVVLRAPRSNVVTLAKDIYLRTGGGKVESGDIFLDASMGEKDIITKSNDIHHFVKEEGRIYQYFGGREVGGTEQANMFSKKFNLLGSKTSVGGDIYVDGKYLGADSILINKGHIITEKGGPAVPCQGDCKKDIDKFFLEVRDFTEFKIPEAGNAIDQANEVKWYLKERAGNERVMSILEFSWRTDEQYKIQDFMLYEDRWQQMARIGGKTVKRWTEKPVVNSVCGETYPFPGKKWLQESPVYKEQDFKIVQNNDGYIDKERNNPPGLASEYKEPEFKEPQKKIINGNYPIIPRT